MQIDLVMRWDYTAQKHTLRPPTFSLQQSPPGHITSRSCNPFTSGSEEERKTALTKPLSFLSFFLIQPFGETCSVLSAEGVGMLSPICNIQLRSNIGYRHNITDRDKWSMDNCAGLWLTVSAHPPWIIVLCFDWLQHSYLWPALFKHFQAIKATVATS